MRIRLGLLFWLFRQTWPVTAVGVALAFNWALFAREALGFSAYFVFLHSLAIVSCLGRFRSGEFGLLYTRGHTRDTLWAHTMLATVMAVLAVWLPTSLTIWLPLRPLAQYFVYGAPVSEIVCRPLAPGPWLWLGGYAFFVPLFHYVWIRQAYPCRYPDDGIWLAVGALLCEMRCVMLTDRFPDSTTVSALVGLFRFGLPALLLIVGWRLHRRTEAHS